MQKKPCFTRRMKKVLSPIREKALNSEEFIGLLDSREIGQILDWSIEVLQAQFEILLGELDRYSGEAADGEPAAWFVPLLEDLGGLERVIEDLWIDGVAVGLCGLDERAEAILEFSDRLLEYADEAIESNGEVRLSLRLRGMAR